MQRRHRLSRSRDFDAVYRHGKSVSTRFLVLYWFPREDDADGEPRLGLAVPKAAGKAVVRNKIRRRLRAAFRAYGPGAADVVLIGRAAVATERYSLVEESVKECLRVAGAPRCEP